MQAEDPSMSEHDEQTDQKRIFKSLAVECNVSIAEAAILCEDGKAELALGARITTFLDIFAIRNVQDILCNRELDKYIVPPGGSALRAA
jgi:hypothetical protein